MRAAAALLLTARLAFAAEAGAQEPIPPEASSPSRPGPAPNPDDPEAPATQPPEQSGTRPPRAPEDQPTASEAAPRDAAEVADDSAPLPGQASEPEAEPGDDVDAESPVTADEEFFDPASLDEEEDDTAAPIPPAADTRGAHFLASVGAALWVPMGRLESGLPTSDLFGPSLALTATAAVGISRTTVVGLWGHFAPLSGASDCADCDGRYFAGGPFVRYHLAQGIRADPWLSLGVGVRTLTAEQAGAATEYLGLDWLRLRFGGDFYPTRNFGFGPFIEWNLGNALSKSSGELHSRVYAQFLLGAELAFDIPGK